MCCHIVIKPTPYAYIDDEQGLESNYDANVFVRAASMLVSGRAYSCSHHTTPTIQSSHRNSSWAGVQRGVSFCVVAFTYNSWTHETLRTSDLRLIEQILLQTLTY